MELLRARAIDDLIAKGLPRGRAKSASKQIKGSVEKFCNEDLWLVADEDGAARVCVDVTSVVAVIHGATCLVALIPIRTIAQDLLREADSRRKKK